MAAKTQKVALEMLLKSEQFKKAVRKAAKETTKVGDATEKGAKKSTGFLKQMKAGWLAVAAVIAGTVRAIVRFGKKAIAAAEENEVAQLKLQKVFRGSMKIARQSVKELTSQYAMSGTEATKMLSGIQDLLVPMGLMRSKAAALSGTVAKLAADIGAFNGQPTETVINAIQSAMVGMNRPMMQYGVVLTAATVKQEAMNLKLYDGTGEINAAAKAQAALSLITKGSGDAIGAMADQWDTWAVSMKRIKAFGDDVTNMIGDELVAAFKPALDEIGKFIGQGEGLEKIRKWIRWIVGGVKILGNILAMTSIWEVFRLIGIAASTMKDVALAAFQSIGDAIQAIWDRDWDALKASWKKGFVEAAEAGWKGLVEAGEGYQERIGNIRQAWKDMVAQEKQDEADAEDVAREEAVAKHEMWAEEDLDAALYEDGRLREIEEEHTSFLDQQAQLRKLMATKEWQTFTSLAKQAMSDVTKLMRARTKAEIKEIEKKKNAFIKSLDAQLKAGTISEDEYQERKVVAERKAQMEIAKAQRKAFFMEQKAKIASIVMNTALAIMTAVAQLGPIAGAVAAGLMAILGGVQIAAVKAEDAPEIPAFAKGGIVQNPQIAQVGERGPEAIVPLPANFADMLAGASGDTNTNNNMGGVTIVVEGAGDPDAVADAVYEKMRTTSDNLGQGNLYRE